MKRLILLPLSVLIFVSLLFCMTADEYISNANDAAGSGDLSKAVDTLKKAAAEYPDNSDIYAAWGLYTGQMAGGTDDMMEAFSYTTESFNLLDKALELDPKNANALLYRGIMGINVPRFLGRLKGALNDLIKIEAIYLENREDFPIETLITSYRFLAAGYESDGQLEKALETWKKVHSMGLEDKTGQEAEKKIHEIEAQLKETMDKSETPQENNEEGDKAQEGEQPLNPEPIKDAEALFDSGDYEKAAGLLRKIIENDPDNLEAYLLLASTLDNLSSAYDDRIYDDTNYRAALGFEVASIFDAIVRLDPDNMEMRLQRGIIGVNMPFFVGKLDQGIKDLNLIAESDASEDLKAEALYWIGYAYRKKAVSCWNKVVKDYPESHATELVYDSMRPAVSHFDHKNAAKPVLTIDFILGFRDELEPQTAVWIEDNDGKFIKTIYVSGFAGFVKDKQVTLSQWAESSKFADADAMTSASIDIGHHIYSWDLTDSKGERVENGDYNIKIEVFHWPAMKYQLACIPVSIGKEETSTISEKGKIIPRVIIHYYPE